MPLNPQQQKVVNHTDGPLLVVSGPGSGKTTVITHRTARLLGDMGVAPRHLLVVTFSRKAANEMRKRIQQLLQGTGIRITKEQFTTIHSFGYQIVHRYQGRPNIISGRDQNRLLRDILGNMDLWDKRDPQTLRDLKGEISYVRSHQLDLSDSNTNYKPQVLDREPLYDLLRQYRDGKQRSGLCDYGDLLEDALHLLTHDLTVRHEVQNRYRYVSLDEAQDTSPLQFKLITTVAAPHNNLVVVGDDDQAIYSFRGGSPEMMLAFPTLYENATIVKMTTNYRSASNIVQLSQHIIEHNNNRFDKDLQAATKRESTLNIVQPKDTHDQVTHIMESAKHHGAFQRPGEMAVIYRMNVQAVPLIDRLVDTQQPFRLLSTGSRDLFQRPILEDMMAFLRLVNHPEAPYVDDVVQIINKPTRYIPHDVLQDAKDHLPDISADIWRVLMNHPALSNRQQSNVRSFYQSLTRYQRAHHGLSDHDTLDDFLSKASFNYKKYLSDQAGNDDSRAKVYRRQFRTYQTLAHNNDFVERVLDIREAVRVAVNRTSDEPGLILTTCHSAKGLEWPKVWLMDVLQDIQPSAAVKADDSIGDLQEERRLFYVAWTRTSDALTVSVPKKYAGREALVSQFIVESQLLPDNDPRVTKFQKQREKKTQRQSRQTSITDPRPKQKTRHKTRKTPKYTIEHPVTNSDQLKPSMQLVHRQYGNIKVGHIDPSRDIVRIKTNDGKRKELHLETCIKQGLLGFVSTAEGSTG